MNIICQHELCTGCSACINVCSKHCIEMQPDQYGVLLPNINQQECIDCGLCVKNCPVNAPAELNNPNKCFAVWQAERLTLKKSASGGVAASLYLYFIQHLKGVVYGVSWDKELRPVFKRTERIEDLELFKGSKYVQAFVNDIYQYVKKDLLNNRQVLFVGTPCQIAGLKNYLRKDYHQLFTCDLVCHGVPPYDYFKDEIRKIYKNKKLQVTNCRFRGNDEYNYHFSLWNHDTLLYDKRGSQSYYFYGFLTSITLRESCYSCRYSTNMRIGDMTLGDFIGIGKLQSIKVQPKNLSVVTINTEKAQSIWTDLLEKYPTISYEVRPYEEAIKGGGSFRQPTIRNFKRDKFLEDYKRYGWNNAIRKALWKSILRNLIKRV